MSSLRKYQDEPKFLISTALNLFRSKKIKTVVVEGVCDKRFLSQWQKKEIDIRYAGFDGKKIVEDTFSLAQKPPYSNHDFLYYFADVDYDGVVKNGLHFHKNFIYNAYCFEKDDLIFNDLEIFLVNTNAFSKVLVNHDIELKICDEIRTKLEAASRNIGAFRAADILLQKRERLTSSVLNGLKVEEFFDNKNICFDIEKLKLQIPNWTNKKHLVIDLIEIAEQLLKNSILKWELSRGHDVTEMLSLHLEFLGFKGTNAQKVELCLRLACEKNEYKDSPMGKKLRQLAAEDCFLEFAD
jgi:hypothetical protein